MGTLAALYKNAHRPKGGRVATPKDFLLFQESGVKPLTKVSEFKKFAGILGRSARAAASGG